MDFLIFFIRLLFIALLYAFLGALFFFLWRDIRQTARQTSTPAARERPAQLQVQHGGAGFTVGDVIPLTTYTTIGRAESNVIAIADPYASGEHALLAWRSGQWWLEDRDSRNGTLLNELPVDAPVVLSHGDVIGIGQMRFQFELCEMVMRDT
jgi:hypothetical protein